MAVLAVKGRPSSHAETVPVAGDDVDDDLLPFALTVLLEDEESLATHIIPLLINSLLDEDEAGVVVLPFESLSFCFSIGGMMGLLLGVSAPMLLHVWASNANGLFFASSYKKPNKKSHQQLLIQSEEQLTNILFFFLLVL